MTDFEDKQVANNETMEDAMNSVQEVSVGDIVKGEVLAIEDKQVVVGIEGAGVEGVVPAKELSTLPVEDVHELVKVGDVLDLVVITSIGKDKENGSYLLSKRRLDAKKVWEEIEQDFQAGKVIEAPVTNVVKGGLVVDVGVRGFVLQQFFPEVNLRKLSEIEQFHKQLASVLRKEFTESSKSLQSMVDLISANISDLEAKISDISDIPNVSQAILDKYAEVRKEITQLQDSNKNYVTKKQLQETFNTLKAAYDALIQKIFETLQQEIDSKMRQINDDINLSKKTAPYLTISSAKSYEFFTPKDRGTGSEYKGLIVFDLAMLEETPLPILVHDSILLKQIQDESLERIIRFYSTQPKQVFIALDKEESFTPATQTMLKTSTVLRLYPGGGELFGKAWNEESEEK